MEVKLSVSSSRRISFASDIAYDHDLEIEELENRRDNPNRYPNRNRVFSYSYYDYSDDDEDDEEKDENDEDKEDYVNIHKIYNKLFKDLWTRKILFDSKFIAPDLDKERKVHLVKRKNLQFIFPSCGIRE